MASSSVADALSVGVMIVKSGAVEVTFIELYDRLRSYMDMVHAVADFEDFACHAGGVAEETDLAARDVGPINGKLERAEIEFAEEEAKLDIEGKADALLVEADFFKGGAA